MAEYRQGVGPNRLEQGAAKRLNESQPPSEAFGMDMDIPVQFAPRNEPDDVDYGDDSGEDEEMQVLMSPPDEGYRPPMFAGSRRSPRVPDYVVRHMPALMAAARMPDAPPTLRAVYRWTLARLEDEERRGL